MTSRPFALADLARVAGISLGLHGQRGHDGEPRGLVALAELLGISHRWALELQTRGLTAADADRYAVRLGWHPCEVFGELWWHHAAPDLFPLPIDQEKSA